MSVKKILLSTLALAVFLVPSYSSVHAVDVFNDVCRGSGSNSAACKDSNNPRAENPLFGPEGVLTRIIDLLSIVVGIVAVIVIIIGALKFVTSGSNPEDVSKSRELILYALVALVITALAQILVRFVISKVG